MVRMVLVWSVVISATLACSRDRKDAGSSSAGQQERRTLRLCYPTPPPQLDPLLETDATSGPLLEELYDGLVDVGVDGVPRPSLAASWTVSDDQLSWTFELRPDAQWSDGQPLTAHDVVAHVVRAVHPATRNPYVDPFLPIRGVDAFHQGRLRRLLVDTGPFRAGAYVDVVGESVPEASVAIDGADETLPATAVTVRGPDGREASVPSTALSVDPGAVGVVAVDEHTLRLDLAVPQPGLPYLLARWPWRPTRHGGPIPRPGSSATVYSGPFILSQSDHDRWILEAADTFWGREELGLDRVEVSFLQSQSDLVSEFLEGDCDATAGDAVPVDRIQDPELGPFLRRSPYLGVYGYIVNTEVVPRTLRRALALAVERKPIVALLSDLMQPSTSLVPWGADGCNGEPGLRAAGGRCYRPAPGLPEDRDAARAELTAARGADQPPPRITLTFNAGPQGHRLIAEELARQWGAIGIEVALDAPSWKQYLRKLPAGEFQVARVGWIGTIPAPGDQFLSVFTCNNPTSFTRWCDRRFDELLTRAAVAHDPAVRLDLERQAESILLEEAVVIPLYVYSRAQLVRPHVVGLEPNMLDAMSLRQVRLLAAEEVSGSGDNR